MAQAVKRWTFASKSNPKATPHETTEWDTPPEFYRNGKVTCNCGGWTKRVNGGVRTCPHVRMVDSGIADDFALNVWEPNSPRPVSAPKATVTPKTKVKTKAKKTEAGALPEGFSAEQTRRIVTL